MPDNSVDTVVTDPPYGLSFMGKDWDYGVPGEVYWREVLRVAKPGAMLLAFGGTRTYHRLTVAIEDAGWEIRDCVMWLYGSGFPKSANISKLIDKAAGAEREVVGIRKGGTNNANGVIGAYNFRGRDIVNGSNGMTADVPITAPATPEAATWDGWGSSLKPAWESIILATKPNRPLTQEQLFYIMSIVNFQLQMEIALCQVRLRSDANNAESHLKHLAQKSKEVVENIALGRVWAYPNEGELVRFADSVGKHLNDLLVGLNGTNLAIALNDARETINVNLQGNQTITGLVESLCDLMGTLLSDTVTHTDLSMMLSWNNALTAALSLMSKFTTSTVYEATTVLRTLNLSLYQNISESITHAKNVQTNGYLSVVPFVETPLIDASLSMNGILTHIAAASATQQGEKFSTAWEPIIVAMKPLDGTYAHNALTHGVAGLWIDGARVGTDDNRSRPPRTPNAIYGGGNGTNLTASESHPQGRWPANLIHDGSPEVVQGFPVTTQAGHNTPGKRGGTNPGMWAGKQPKPKYEHGDTGSAARFFYCAKASRAERNAGLEGLPAQKVHPAGNGFGETTMWNGENGDDAWKKKNPNNPQQNFHPTVKPLELMRYLVRLTRTPFGGVVLDPFMGSGTTGVACVYEGRDFIGIDMEPEYVEIARRRIAHAEKNNVVTQPSLLDGVL